MSGTLGSFNNNNTSSIVAGTNIFTPLTINSSNGVTFYQSNGSTLLGSSISNDGIFNSSGFVLSGPLSCSSININSNGSISCLSAINNYGNITTNGLILSNNTNLTCNSNSSTNGLSCNGTITSITFLIGSGTYCAMSGLSTLNMSGSLSCTNELNCQTSMTGIGANCSMSGISTLNVNSLTCANASCGSLVVNNGNTTNFVNEPSISGVTNISSQNTLNITTDLYGNNGNKIKCTSVGVVSGVTSLTMSGDLNCNSLNNSSNLTITNTGAVSGVTTLTMSEDLSCNNLSFNGFTFNNSGNITANSLKCTNIVFPTSASGFKTISTNVSGITSLTSTGSVTCTNLKGTNIDISNNISITNGVVNLGSGYLNCQSINKVSMLQINGSISGINALNCSNINSNSNYNIGAKSITSTNINGCTSITANILYTPNIKFSYPPYQMCKGIQCGSAFTLGGGTSIVFTPTFTSTPYVLCTSIAVVHDYIFCITPYNITTAGFSVNHTYVFYNSQGGAANQSFNWIAMNMSA